MTPNPLAGLSLRDLEYAVAVADLGQFSRAAERCGVSQAGLSDQIRKLEAQLGLALFERTTRRVAVTAEGEALLRQAREVIGAVRVLLELARSRADPLTGPLRLGVIATLGPYYLPGVLYLVRRRYPKLALRLLLPTSPGSLLLLEEGYCLRDQALSLCGAVRSRRETRFASSLEMLRHMIAADEGYSLLPLLATRERSDLDGLMRVREVAEEEVGRQIGLAWRHTIRVPRPSTSLPSSSGLLRRQAPARSGCCPASVRPSDGGRFPPDRIVTRRCCGRVLNLRPPGWTNRSSLRPSTGSA
jgi:LysR family transcriptional regulator, hydrogen peroxide-inducible genes activator